MPARISSAVLVGRDDALATLGHAIQLAIEGSPRFVVVRGEAGIGKSRLVTEAVKGLPDGAFLLVGECLDIGAAGLPYLPIAEALRRLGRTADRETLDRVLGQGRADLAVLVPELAADDATTAEAPQAEQVRPAAQPTLTSGLAQARLFERVLGLLRALSELGPTVFVIEDVHWIDRATRDLLTFLASNVTDEALAIVLTIREGDLFRGHPILAWLAELERSPSTVVVEPRRLDRAAVERQLRQIAGAELAPDVAERIWRRSEGNPLFVEELLAAGADEVGPRSAVEVLLARVARLDPPARAVVDAAAVAGRPADDRLLADVLEVPESVIDAPLRSAIDNGVLELEPMTDRYRFRHELLREVVESQLLPGARRRLHERFARRLEARPELADASPAGAAGELAVHFAEAGLAPEAYERSIRAAAAAEAVSAYADAHRHLERALDLERLTGVGADPAGRIDLRARAADDADLEGDFERSLELTQAALDLVDVESDPVFAGVLNSRIGYLRWSLGEGEAALASHEEAVRLVPAEPPTAERAKVLGSLGGALMGELRWAESRALCEAAIACAIAAGDAAEESRARNMLGSDLVALGDIEGGIGQLREACRIAELAGRSDMLIIGHHNLALNLAAADHLDESVAEARAGLAVARAAGLERRFGQDLAALAADALTRLGRIHEAERAASDGLALDPRGRGSSYLSAVCARLASIRGDHEEAARRLAEMDVASLDPDVAGFVAAVAAEAYTWAGRPAAAVEIADAVLARLDPLEDVVWSAPLVALGLRGVAELAEAARAQRGDDDAGSVAERLDRYRARVARMTPLLTTTSGRGWMALARGELATAEGNRDSGAWHEAIALFDAVPDPLLGAYARLRAAEADLRAHGLRADVAEMLGVAAEVADRTGARPLAAAVATLASRARIATPARPSTAVEEPGAVATPPAGDADPRAAAMALGLSAREVEVLELVTEGLTNGEIAERLFITRKTAAVHVTHILDKLGVANRVGAAMIGARVGLGRVPSDYASSE